MAQLKMMLKSHDVEILALYADIAIRQMTVNQVNSLLNSNYEIHVNDGYYYLQKKRKSYNQKTKERIKLSFTFKNT